MTQLDEYLASAHAALEAGNRLVARGYLRRAVSAVPDRLDVWQDLLAVTDLPTDRLRCLERIVELEPEDTQAQAALEQLRQEIAEAKAAEAEAQAAAQAAAQAQALADSEQLAGEGALAEPVHFDMRQGITDEMRQKWDQAVAAGEPLYCIDHPHRETNLRCNRCGAPVCTDCLQRTPVGLRCKECIRAQQAAFFTARWYDYPVAALVALVLAVPGAVLASMVGIFITIILSPFAGGLIGGAVHWAIGRRRGRGIGVLVGACVVLGALAALSASPFGSNLLSIGIYAAMASGAAMGVLRFGGRRR
jgi:hypothetical protein